MILWGTFLGTAILLNRTIPFALGFDVREWTSSSAKAVGFDTLVYAGLFLVAPLLLSQGWRRVRQPAFIVPLAAAVAALTLRSFARPLSGLVIPVLGYLHWRFDLADLGIRSRGWRGDLTGILLLGGLTVVPGLLGPGDAGLDPGSALRAGLDRLFANPASTTENLFYFGLLAERISGKATRWLTPVAIGLMYMTYEMTNPEYWYESMRFGMVFLGVAVTAAVYLWRRSIVVVWLGDGLSTAIQRLL